MIQCTPHHGGGSVLAWECTAAGGTGPLLCVDVTADRCGTMNSQV